jgi:hypothetical protein
VPNSLQNTPAHFDLHLNLFEPTAQMELSKLAALDAQTTSIQDIARALNNEMIPNQHFQGPFSTARQQQQHPHHQDPAAAVAPAATGMALPAAAGPTVEMHPAPAPASAPAPVPAAFAATPHGLGTPEACHMSPVPPSQPPAMGMSTFETLSMDEAARMDMDAGVLGGNGFETVATLARAQAATDLASRVLHTPPAAHSPPAGRLAEGSAAATPLGAAAFAHALDRRVPAAEQRRSRRSRRSASKSPAAEAKAKDGARMLIENMIRTAEKTRAAKATVMPSGAAGAATRQAAGSDADDSSGSAETSGAGSGAGASSSRPRRANGSHSMRGRGGAKRSSNTDRSNGANKRRAGTPKANGPRKRECAMKRKGPLRIFPLSHSVLPSR